MKKILNFTLLAVGILGFIKILTIVPFDRMAADDFSFTTPALKGGILSSQVTWYETFTGKFTTNFFMTIAGIIFSKSGNTSLFVVFTLGLLLAAFYVLVKAATKSRLKLLNAGLVILSLLVSYYLLTPDKRESWYWMAGAITYLWPTIFAIATIGLILKEKISILSRVLIFFLSFLVGAGHEVVATLFLACAFSSLLFITLSEYVNTKERNLIRLLKSLIRRNPIFGNVAFAFAGSILSFVIMFVAPGNWKRLKSPGSDEMSNLGTILYSLQKGPELLFSIVHRYIIYIVSLIAVLSAYFSLHNIDFDPRATSTAIVLRKIFTILVIPVFLSVVYMLPGYKSLGRLLPSRSEVNLSVIIILSLLFASLYIAKIISKFNLSKRFIYQAIVVFFALGFFLTSVAAFTKTIAEDVYVAKSYSAAFDRMFMQLKEVSSKDMNQVVIVDPLPESGLIHSEKLNTDTNHWANRPISEFFGLKGIKVAEIYE